MALDSYRYRDPAEVAEIHEAREQRNNCRWCIHKIALWGVDYCAVNDGVSGSRMQRCEKFNDGKGM